LGQRISSNTAAITGWTEYIEAVISRTTIETNGITLPKKKEREMRRKKFLPLDL